MDTMKEVHGYGKNWVENVIVASERKAEKMKRAKKGDGGVKVSACFE